MQNVFSHLHEYASKINHTSEKPAEMCKMLLNTKRGALSAI